MQGIERDMRVRVDSYTRVCLTAIACLLTIIVLGLWADVGISSHVRAQEPVSRENRYQPRSTIDIGEMLAQQQMTNQKLDQIIKLLENGSAKVQVVEAAATASRPEVPSGVIQITPQK